MAWAATSDLGLPTDPGIVLDDGGLGQASGFGVPYNTLVQDLIACHEMTHYLSRFVSYAGVNAGGQLVYSSRTFAYPTGRVSVYAGTDAPDPRNTGHVTNSSNHLMRTYSPYPAVLPGQSTDTWGQEKGEVRMRINNGTWNSP